MAKKPEKVSPAEYARRRGLSPSTVYNAIREGRCPRTVDGKIQVDLANKVWPEVKHKDGATVISTNVGGEAMTLTEARTRKAAAEAQAKELDLAKKRGELVEIETVAQVYYGTLRKLRNRLRAIPGRVSALVAASDDVGEVRRMISDDIDDALRMVDLEDGDE